MNDSEIPQPDSSGNSGKQVSTSHLDTISTPVLCQSIQPVDAINELANSNSRALGGSVPSTLVAAIANQLEGENKELKQRLIKCKSKCESLRDELEESRTSAAVLKEKVNSEAANKHVRNLAITIGTAIIGLGVTLGAGGNSKYEMACYVLGVVLLIAGWFTGGKKETE